MVYQINILFFNSSILLLTRQKNNNKKTFSQFLCDYCLIVANSTRTINVILNVILLVRYYISNFGFVTTVCLSDNKYQNRDQFTWLCCYLYSIPHSFPRNEIYLMYHFGKFSLTDIMNRERVHLLPLCISELFSKLFTEFIHYLQSHNFFAGMVPR